MIAGIGAIETLGAVAAADDHRRARRPRRRFPLDPGEAVADADADAADDDEVGERARIADGLSIARTADALDAAGDWSSQPSVTAAIVGRHIAAARAQALAMQARIGAAAVGALIRAAE